MNIKDKVLVVEDEKGISGFIRAILTANGYDVILAHTGAEAFSMISSHCPDLIVLDLGLPDMDGMTILRQWTQIPIVVVSARTYERDKVEALDKGADDYITKPFGAAELLARIRVAIRHTRSGLANESLASSGKFVAGGLTIDYDKRRIYLDDQEVHLTQVEYKIVMLTMLHIGKVLTYDFIIRCVWGARPTVNNQILRVNMANIRRKLEANPADPQFIITETGVGYRMIDHAEENV